MGEYKHYVNPKEPGLSCFVTSTCLDFAHLFKRPEMRSRMCLSLLQDCNAAQASLSAYVVMTHHIHLVVRPRDDQPITRLMQKIKANSARALKPLLQADELKQLDQQDDLNQHSFWQRSFRSNPLYTSEVFVQKSALLASESCPSIACGTARKVSVVKLLRPWQ